MSLETTETVEQNTEVESQTSTETTESTAAPTSAREAVEMAEKAEADKSKAEAVADLESFSKVKFDGKEFSPKELRSMFMMQSDYTKKTKEIAAQQKEFEAESKYQANLSADLASVKANPELAEAFKQAYPQKYHGYLNLVVAEQRAEMKDAQAAQDQGIKLPPEIAAKLAKYDELERKVSGLESTFDEQKAAAINAELDATFAPLAEKYPYADEEQVIARAQAILEKDPNATLNKETWDNLFKAAHQRVENLVKTKQSQAVAKQKQANKQASGSAPGGQSPIKAPTRFNSMREAAEALKQTL